MGTLLNKILDVNKDVIRNIVSLRKSQDLFDDLSNGQETLSAIAIAAEMRVKRPIPSDMLSRGFHYTTAISYPFATEPFMASRYGDGTFPVWYSSFELKTSIYETAYHMFYSELSIEGVNEIIIRERAVYDVNCHALLFDITDKHKDYPQLVTDSYDFTQQLGRKLSREGHPGLLAPSARFDNGINAVIFNRSVLSNLRIKLYLTYKLDPYNKTLLVERKPGKTCLKLNGKIFGF